jgi:hypothetical protein
VTLGAKKAANCPAPSNACAFVAFKKCCWGWLPGVHPRIVVFLLQMKQFVKIIVYLEKFKVQG